MIPAVEMISMEMQEPKSASQSIIFLEVQKQIFTELQTQEAALEAIRTTEAPLIIKWQKFLGVVLPIQMNVLKVWSLGEDQAALSAFNEQFMEAAANDPALREINEQKWIYLFEKAFGLNEVRKITLEEARHLVSDIATAMVSEDFLSQVDQAIENLGKDPSVLSKRQALLTVLFPLHMSVMSKHGFEGETGYIQAQKALMDYYFDAEISANVFLAQEVVFKRSKLQ